MEKRCHKTVIDALLAVTNQSSPSTKWHNKTYQSTDEILECRTESYKQFLWKFAQDYKTEGGCILDVACGSGLDSAIFLEHGHKVVSFDICENMMQLCRRNKQFLVEQLGDKFKQWEILEGDMTKLSEHIRNYPDIPASYDCIVCLGNSIPFLLILRSYSNPFRQDADLLAAFQGFYDSLRPGGAVLFDTRNYHPVVAKGLVNQKGRNPMIKDSCNGVMDALPYPVYAPGSTGHVVAALFEFINFDGSSTLLAYNTLLPDKVFTLLRSVFGSEAKIKILYDLKEETEHSSTDACWVTYIVEKPVTSSANYVAM